MQRTAITITSLLALISGCAQVTRATPEALINAPGSTAILETSMSYDAAYRKTFHQMKSCFEAGGAYLTHISVYGDKGADDGIISVGVSGILGHRVMATFKLKPIPNGTSIDIFAASESSPGNFTTRLDYWLNKGGTDCGP